MKVKGVGMKTVTVGLVFLLLLCGCAHASSPATPAESIVKPHFVGLDIYGTDRLSISEVRSLLAGQLEPCIGKYLADEIVKFKACKAELVAKIQEQYHFAYVDLALVGYFRSGDHPVYGTFDIVEKRDAKERMAFTKRPLKSFADPDGLIQAWEEYQKTGFSLLARGEISNERIPCPAFHCIFGHQHPTLRPYEKIFVDGVAKHKTKLIEIIRFDKDDNRRGLAAYLLAYEKDGNHLIQILSERLRDESDFVRNNITRIFSDIAMFHPDLPLPVGEVAKVLNFPATTDRNKASIFFQGIATNRFLREKYNDVLILEVVPILLKTLRLEQPNNHDPAYTTLRLLSGQNYDKRDYQSWEDWYHRERKVNR